TGSFSVLDFFHFENRPPEVGGLCLFVVEVDLPSNERSGFVLGDNPTTALENVRTGLHGANLREVWIVLYKVYGRHGPRVLLATRKRKLGWAPKPRTG